MLEQLKKDHPGISILITFFSPSGYEVQKDYPGADHVFYLPADSARNAKKFIDLVKPKLVLWVKYEFWHHYLRQLKTRGIPVLLVSGAFRPGQPFFAWYGQFWRNMLQCFTWCFVQNEPSLQLLRTAGIQNASLAGDTRFDRVIAIAENFTEVPGIRDFCGDHTVIVAGSTWEDDEAEWVHFVKANPGLRFIIAPHEIDKENVRYVKKEFPGSVLYSELAANPGSNCIIIDNIGMLSRLYKYAHITYVGGGFGYDGIHNILEAAVYGRPVLFGPETDRNLEAVELEEKGGGLVIENALELERELNRLLGNAGELKEMSDAARDFVYSNAGATQRITGYIQENRLLTS